MDDRAPLTHLLDRVDAVAEGDKVAVRDILHEIGETSFAPFILVIAALMVSPLSGVPGAPTIAAILILLFTVQALVGRRHPWLPDIILRRTVKGKRLRQSVSWLRKPAAWFDRHSRKRWRFITMRPMRVLTMLSICAVVIVWPFLEILPFFTSFGAVAVALLSFGLLTRDGLYVLLGYCFIAVLVGGALALVTGG